MGTKIPKRQILDRLEAPQTYAWRKPLQGGQEI